MMDTTFAIDSKSMMPRQLFRSCKSPFFGKFFSRPTKNSSGHLRCSHISWTISRTRAKVSSLDTKAFQNSGGTFESPGDLFDLALRIAAMISSSVGTAAKSSRTGRCWISSRALISTVEAASYTRVKCSCTVLGFSSIDDIEPSTLRNSDARTGLDWHIPAASSFTTL